MGSGIYELKIHNETYIGSSQDIKTRLRQHISNLTRNKHCNRKLQNKYNKYATITTRVIEYCKPSELILREQYYIDTLKPKLNIRMIAENNLGVKQSFITRFKRSIRVQLFLNDTLIHVFSSLTQSAKELGVAVSTISRAIKNNKEVKGYKLQKATI